MRSVCVRILLSFIVLLTFFVAQSAAEQRTALIIGNSAYSTGPLRNPVNDATDIASALKKAGFTVVLKRNATLQVMEEAIEDFGNRLKKGGVGLFYYAGHGVQVGGVNYLIPIGAKINKESDIKFKAFDTGRVLAEMENANNGLNILILDACRDNPFGRQFRSTSRGLAIVSNAPVGTFISYSTGAGQVARDGEGRNSPYTAALLKYMRVPGMSINDVFMNVRQKLRKDTGQVPWELSSLEGKFYFLPANTPKEIDEAKTALAKAEDVRMPSISDEKEIASPYSVERTEIRRDGRFIAYDNGTVLDTRTNLMWAAHDNGRDINWQDAKIYCEKYRIGGYKDWRMPTPDELVNLYNPAIKGNGGYRLTTLMTLSSCCPWSSVAASSDACYIDFRGRLLGKNVPDKAWLPSSYINEIRALPVRNASSDPREILENGRFIADNGTVTDTKTGLMWAAKDNGEKIDWPGAKSFIENYRGGGFTDWRMPTWNELESLCDKSRSYKAKNGMTVHLTGLIELSSDHIWGTQK